MTNFLEFIEEDIKSKKTLFSTMPVSTKTNKRKFNEKIDATKDKYLEYEDSIKKYIELKSRSFEVRDDKDISQMAATLADLESVRFILNPTNTYFEKMGFDTLLFQISSYNDFNFHSLNEIINELFNKFELAGVLLTNDDFDYTCYVNEFMTSFIQIRSSKSNNYDHLTEIFEKLYWDNPELIVHIELNFRKLIMKNEKKFTEYIDKLKSQVELTSGNNYETCLQKLEVAYRNLNNATKENITDIIDLAKNSELDINNYFEDSKIRTTTFSSLMIDSIDFGDEVAANKFYDSLGKLKNNVEEYVNYIKFSPLILFFKNTHLKKATDGPKVESKNLKDIENKIAQSEAKLAKVNKKIFGQKPTVFMPKETNVKELKFESVKIANELNALYKEHTEEYFKSKALSAVNDTFTITDLLHLYYSFDFYKKEAIRKVYSTTTYEEIIEYSDSFDLFAMNPMNVIVCAASQFNVENIAKVIINKYRLANINITDEDINPDDLTSLLGKLNLTIRVREIEKSPVSVEKIWFMVQVKKLYEEEKKKS